LKKVIVIGSGFAGLAAAANLARYGASVTVLEKNDSPGGRARKFTAEGFTFDMGPSWYWMPEVFDNFFRHFGHRTEDFYELKRLDPSYRIVFENETVDVPAQLRELYELFEKIEPGSSRALKEFLDEAAYKYKVGMEEFVFKPSYSIREFADWRIVQSLFQLQMFSSVSSVIRKHFKDERLIQLLEFPVLFLGATPQKTPAMYSLMNYADLVLGTWYPMGGMHEIVKAMVSVCEAQGVHFEYNAEVRSIDVKNGLVRGVETAKGYFEADVLVSGADYHHTDRALLPEKYSNYSKKYWDSRVMAPSSLLFYLGVDGKIPGLLHHNLFFDADFEKHAREIYEEPAWPDRPLFYVCAPSVTDPAVAPEGKENLFFLVPLAPGLEDTEELREQYFEMILSRFEDRYNFPVREQILYRRSYAHRDFQADYHAFKGNAYGLANTLRQTAFLKPRLNNKRVTNLYYTGQLTTPGPGMPPSIISGQVVAAEIAGKFFLHKK